MLMSDISQDVAAALLFAHYPDHIRGVVIDFQLEILNAAPLGCSVFGHLTEFLSLVLVFSFGV